MSSESSPSSRTHRADLASATAALLESESRFRDLVESAHDVIFTLDAAGLVTSFNRAGERLAGFARGDLLGRPLTRVLAPDSPTSVKALLERAGSGHASDLAELAVLASDGRRLELEVSVRTVVSEGVESGWLCVGRDVTGRKRTEDALRQSEERFRLLVENSSDAVTLVAADGVIFYASRPIARILGYQVEEFVGRSLLEIVHPDDRDRMSWVLIDWRSKPGVAVSAELSCLHRDGSWRDIEMVGTNRLTEPGIGALVVNLRDVTERTRAAQALQESDDLFRAVFESALIGIARIDLEGRVVDCNRALQDMSRCGTGRLKGMHVRELVHADDRKAASRELAELAAGTRDAYRAEHRLITPDGTTFWVNMACSLVRDAAQSPRFAVAMFENVTERKETEERLRETNSELASSVTRLERQTRDITLLSEMGDLLQACRSAEEAYAVIGPMAAQLFPGESGSVGSIAGGGTHVDTVATWGEAPSERVFGVDDCWALRRGRAHLVADRRLGLICRHMPSSPATSYLCVPMMAHGELLGLMTLTAVGRHVDATQRLAMTVAEHLALALANLKLHETLRSQSIRDPLTGLFNRRYMEESLEREMRRAVRSRAPVGIIMLDLDHFKSFNDTHGHDAGDALLRAVGGILQRSVRAEDIACRYGGEEFILILPEASLIDASNRAEYLKDAIKGLLVPHRRQHLPPCTVSAGVAIYPDHGPTAANVLRAADEALYQAKLRGRDRVTVNHAGGLFSGGIVEYSSGGSN